MGMSVSRRPVAQKVDMKIGAAKFAIGNPLRPTSSWNLTISVMAVFHSAQLPAVMARFAEFLPCIEQLQSGSSTWCERRAVCKILMHSCHYPRMDCLGGRRTVNDLNWQATNARCIVYNILDRTMTSRRLVAFLTDREDRLWLWIAPL
jgi:hypothetical protein